MHYWDLQRQTAVATVENNMKVPQNVKNRTPCNSAIPLWHMKK